MAWTGTMVRRAFVLRKRRFITWLFGIVVGTLIVLSTSRADEYGLLGDLLFVAGVALVGVATVGRLWCSVYISGYKTHTLVTVGPYAVSRNPLYLFSLIGAAGVGLCTETVTLALVLTAAFLFYYPFLIRAEERDLREAHGSAFDAYVKSTPRFWPSFSRYCEPEQYTVNLHVLRRRVVDSMCFVWIVAILELVEALHAHDLLPKVLRLY
jgi:protein-S-isoprenylcysteine O-methyltransferase Ste14